VASAYEMRAADPDVVGEGHGFSVFAGGANMALAVAVVRQLGTNLGNCSVDRFPDGEVSVQLLESVRRKEVFLVQSTAPPVNDHLVELLALAGACRRAVAARITAIMPYFGYSRADKRLEYRERIMARVVADVLQAVGIAHVVTVDLHTPQIEGFLHAPVDSLSAVPTLCRALRDRLPRDTVAVSPDVGRMRVAGRYAQCLGKPVVVLHKRRESSTEAAVTHVVGEVAGRACLIVDDMISTGGTIAASVAALLSTGARPDMIVAPSHGPLLSDARGRLGHPAIRQAFVTYSVGAPPLDWPNLTVVSVAPLIAAALSRILADGSIGDLS
jgi:ribose-phosphate pyrophosphokinase